MKYICQHTSFSSGVNFGMVQVVSYALVEAMKAYIQQGHTVQLDNMGSSSRPSRRRAAMQRAR
ncbi:MAG: hypothetical protein ACI3ZY_01165 [Parabacteroides sp.]